MNRHYRYENAPQCQVGKMRCCSCGKKITEGQYRYHETADAYVPCHRQCCPTDPTWAEMDAIEVESKRRRKEFEADVLAFFDKWGYLDDEDFIQIVNRHKAHGQPSASPPPSHLARIGHHPSCVYCMDAPERLCRPPSRIKRLWENPT